MENLDELVNFDLVMVVVAGLILMVLERLVEVEMLVL